SVSRGPVAVPWGARGNRPVRAWFLCGVPQLGIGRCGRGSSSEVVVAAPIKARARGNACRLRGGGALATKRGDAGSAAPRGGWGGRAAARALVDWAESIR